MQSIEQVLQDRLDNKRRQLSELRQELLVQVQDEITTSCFERNTTTRLHSIMELKAEIHELTYIVQLIKATNNLSNRKKG